MKVKFVANRKFNGKLYSKGMVADMKPEDVQKVRLSVIDEKGKRIEAAEVKESKADKSEKSNVEGKGAPKGAENK